VSGTVTDGVNDLCDILDVSLRVPGAATPATGAW